MKNQIFKTVLVVLIGFALAGCTFIFQSGKRSDARKIEELSSQLDELNRAKSLLEERLGGEIQDRQVKLQMMEKGLVITVVGDLVFDSGKAKIRPEAHEVLNKVARVLKENMADFYVGVEGHTDNVPIKRSSWKSNWELSSARALAVLHYLEKDEGVAPERLSAIGYGEFQSVASNDTKDGRQANRRVEIVIMPKLTKVTESKGALLNMQEPPANLK